MEIISVGHHNFLIEVDFNVDFRPQSCPRSSCMLPPNTLNIIYKTKVGQNKVITRINFLEKKIVWPTIIFYSKFCVGWNLMRPTLLLVIKISMGSRKLLWPTAIILFGTANTKYCI